MKTKSIRWQSILWHIILGALLLTTFSFRMWALETVPPGLTHDEAANGHDSTAILRGVHRIYFPVGYGREPLYNYSAAVTTLFLGQRIFTLRITTVFWSLLTWVCTVALARRWWGPRAAIYTAAAMTVAFWPLMMARVGLRAPTLPALLAASTLCYDHALTAARARRAWRNYILSGITLGACLYTYMASRGMPLLYILFLMALAAFDRATLHKTWKGTLTVLATAGLVSLPFFRYLALHPELEQRIAQLGSALVAIRAGNWQPLLKNITASLPMLLWEADPRWLYNIGGRPALEPLLAVAFLAGTACALAHLKDRRSAFVLLWLGGGLAPAFLTAVEYNTLHAIAAMPAVFLLVGLGLDTLTTWTSRQLYRIPLINARHITSYFLQLTLLAAFVLTAAESTHAYFVTWGQNRDVRVNYHHHVVALGQHIEANRQQTPVVITSLYPGEFHDPYTMEVTLHREDLSIRWSDGRSALFFPHGETRLYTETQSAPQPPLSAFIDNYIRSNETLTFSPDDIPDTIYSYDWDTDAAWTTLQSTLNRKVYAAPGDPPPEMAHAEINTPVFFDDTVALTGYRLPSEPIYPNATANLLTAWEVQAPHPTELILFTHMIDETGDVITQMDRLDAPSWQWQPGDRFAQIHALPIPAEIQPGQYYLVVGLYRRADVQRLPVNGMNGTVTRILIPVEVQRQ